MTPPSGAAPGGSGSAAPRWRTLGRARRIGYALLPGDGFSYVLHLRPREWPIMAAHTAIGFVLAVGLTSVLRSERLGAFVIALVAWVVCLNGGTLALNSAFDRDVSDVGYLDAPPPPPPRLALAGALLMLAGQLVALLLPRPFAVAYAVCFAMSVLYSVPPIRLKAVAGADWVINVIGFGALTPYAGWVSSGVPITPTGVWVMVGFGALFAALYPLTQLYQFDEDAERGDRTLALAIGVGGSLRVAVLAALLAFGAFARAAAPGPSSVEWAALAIALAVWLAVLLPWLTRWRAMSAAEHKRGMYRALVAWAVTDLAVVLAFGS